MLYYQRADHPHIMTYIFCDLPTCLVLEFVVAQMARPTHITHRWWTAGWGDGKANSMNMKKLRNPRSFLLEACKHAKTNIGENPRRDQQNQTEQIRGKTKKYTRGFLKVDTTHPLKSSRPRALRVSWLHLWPPSMLSHATAKQRCGSRSCAKQRCKATAWSISCCSWAVAKGRKGAEWCLEWLVNNV